MKLAEIYQNLNELNEVIKDLEAAENGCDYRCTFEATFSRSHVNSIARIAKESRNSLNALLNELEIGNK